MNELPARIKPLLSQDPRTIDGHFVLGRLGEGGQGVVYLVRRSDGLLLALKVLRSQEHAEYLGREARNAGRVPPAYTAELLDLRIGDRGGDYLVSEYLDGPSLQEFIQTNGPLKGKQLRRFAVGLLTVLAAIADAGLVHRDLKPANIVMTDDGPKVIDFGISGRKVTLIPGVIGTPGYMAPEQCDGIERATPASDMWSWGATMAFAASGRTLFKTEEFEAFRQSVHNHERDLSVLAEPLLALVARCLLKEAHLRPTAGEALLTLRFNERLPEPRIEADCFLHEGLLLIRGGSDGLPALGRAHRLAPDRADITRHFARALAARGLARDAYLLAPGDDLVRISWARHLAQPHPQPQPGMPADPLDERSPEQGEGEPVPAAVFDAYALASEDPLVRWTYIRALLRTGDPVRMGEALLLCPSATVIERFCGLLFVRGRRRTAQRVFREVAPRLPGQARHQVAWFAETVVPLMSPGAVLTPSERAALGRIGSRLPPLLTVDGIRKFLATGDASDVELPVTTLPEPALGI